MPKSCRRVFHPRACVSALDSRLAGPFLDVHNCERIGLRGALRQAATAILPEQFERPKLMPLYEHIFMSRQDVSAQQVETMTTEFSKIIEDAGGSITKTEQWGVRPLAYKIKKNRKAHYTLLNIDSAHPAVAEMERLMQINPDILRFVTFKVDEHESEPSAILRKSDRDDRRGGRGGPRRDGGGRPPREDRRPPRDAAPAAS